MTRLASVKKVDGFPKRKRQTSRGVATGVYWYIYPKKSVQVNFLWGKNDIRTAIEHEY